MIQVACPLQKLLQYSPTGEYQKYTFSSKHSAIPKYTVSELPDWITNRDHKNVVP